MKTSSRFAVLALVPGAVLACSTLHAQSPSPAPSATPSVSGPAPGTAAAARDARQEERRAAMKEKIASLTPDEKRRLKTAHRQALQDPAVKAAAADKDSNKRAYRNAVREAMLRSDPGLEPVLAKLYPTSLRRGR